MSPADIAVIAVIAVVAAWPWIASAAAAGWTLARRRPAPAAPIKASGEGWQADWVQTLMALQDEIQAKGGKPDAAVKLCRELIWLLIGGE
jgi:hypothetical protein